MTLHTTSPQAPSVVNQAGVDSGYCGVQIALDDAVKLDALTAGEAGGG